MLGTLQGIAPTFRLAKICSDMNKPNGQYELENSYEKVMDFLRELPIRKECFLRVALGLPGRPSSSDPRRKSISTERTFTPTSSREALTEIMEDVCDMLVKDTKRAGIVGGRCVTLKLKLSSFDVLTRSETPGRLISSREEILAITREILDRELPNEFRLLGIRLSHLQFEDDRPPGAPISVLDFWKRQQVTDFNNCTVNDQPSSSTTSESPSAPDERVSCPICGCFLQNDDRVVNQHVDECLNDRKRKATIDNFFGKRERK
ncbi:hypothetical protein COOONC_18996 [Cooperia oncophora]